MLCQPVYAEDYHSLLYSFQHRSTLVRTTLDHWSAKIPVFDAAPPTPTLAPFVFYPADRAGMYSYSAAWGRLLDNLKFLTHLAPAFYLYIQFYLQANRKKSSKPHPQSYPERIARRSLQTTSQAADRATHDEAPTIYTWSDSADPLYEACVLIHSALPPAPSFCSPSKAAETVQLFPLPTCPSLYLQAVTGSHP